jgi:hypothetical protein
MELFLFIFCIFAAGFVAGKIHTYFHVAKLLRDVAEHAGIDIEREMKKLDSEEVPPEKLVYKLMVEEHGELLYLFDKETDEFICQGSSVQELAKLALERKKINLAAVLHGEKVLQFKNGESTEVIV